MKLLFILLVLFFKLTFSYACNINTDCGQCHFCDKTKQECVQVTPNSDPFDDCGTKCRTKMVCGQEAYCVYQSPPQCDCDWNSGTCKEDLYDVAVLKKRASDVSFKFPPPPLSNTDLELDSEEVALIKEIIEHHRSKKEIDSNESFLNIYSNHLHVAIIVIITGTFVIVFLLIAKINSEVKQQKDIEAQKTQ